MSARGRGTTREHYSTFCRREEISKTHQVEAGGTEKGGSEKPK